MPLTHIDFSDVEVISVRISWNNSVLHDHLIKNINECGITDSVNGLLAPDLKWQRPTNCLNVKVHEYFSYISEDNF